MDVGTLFQGIAVIFDDEINNPETTISKIKQHIQARHIPVAVYNEPPNIALIPSLSKASFVILDWDYTNGTIAPNSDEAVFMADGFREDEEEKLISFIQELLTRTFIPVFIFTSLSTDSIKEKLREAGQPADNRGRIFIKHKSDIESSEALFSTIEMWLRSVPSVYVLKEWERIVSESKNKMFLELNGYSPRWVSIIWDMLQQDTKDHHYAFGEFVTRNLNNRIGEYTFEEAILLTQEEISIEELQKVVQGERFLPYETLESQPEQAYTGDLFKKGGDYYLNIRAQCDLARDKQSDGYNPLLYCIKGKKLKPKDIVSNNIKIDEDNMLVFATQKKYSLKAICDGDEDREEINKEFEKYRNQTLFRKGTFLERADKVIVGCIAGEQAIQFDLNICVKHFNDIRDSCIGRILPPYITRIQQKCSQYMVREGVLPIPKELFGDFDDKT